jgi:hypothetical protein
MCSTATQRCGRASTRFSASSNIEMSLAEILLIKTAGDGNA